VHSAIFEGQLRHRRFSPVDHVFSYRLFMVYMDLSELDRLFAGRWFWSVSRPALARFRREHHLGDPGMALEQSVRALVAEATGSEPAGPIRLLTNLQYFGYCFNPVSFYYCYNREDTEVETIVAEVNNTPWGERHCYVLGPGMDVGRGRGKRYRPVKRMHVSPFMPMDIDYDWRFSQPGDHLSVHMENHRQGEKVFDATLALERREITTSSLARSLCLYPLMTLKVIAAIHWQALRLWLKGSPVYDHPGKNGNTQETST
jgi:DUF1365 family protein